MEKPIKKIDQKTAAIWIIILGLIIAGAIIYSKQVDFKGSFSPTLNSQKAGEKAVKYINENLLEGGEGQEASLVSAEMSGRFLYKLNLSVGGQPFEVYSTKDGKFLFLQTPLNTDEPLNQPAQ